MIRSDGRKPDQLRPVTIERGFVPNSPGSVLYRAGSTLVLATAQISESVPPFLEGKGIGWLTAEYAMLPGSTPTRRASRRATGGPPRSSGSSAGASAPSSTARRSARCTINVDTDVLNADGGTRTAAITAAFVAVADALRRHRGDLAGSILRDSIAAVSVGIVDGEPVLDLDYSEDSTGRGRLQRRPAGRRRPRRGPGHRRGRHLLAGPARPDCSTWPRPGSINWPSCSASASAPTGR